MIAYVEQRSQKSVGSNLNSFGGPDTYFAVQVVPENVERLKVLNSKFASSRGIKLIYCGEGYSKNTGPRSMFGQAYAEACRIAKKINQKEKRS